MPKHPSLRLWYDRPALAWEEALPVGNGRLGAMVFGGIGTERLQLNEDTLWSGGPEDADNPEALPALPRIRELLFAGRYREAQKLADQTQIRKKSATGSFGCYQTLGDLEIVLDGHRSESARDYERELDLEEAMVRVGYRMGEVRYSRETFASAPEQVLVVRIAADRSGQVSFTARLSRPECATVTAGSDEEIAMTGRLYEVERSANGSAGPPKGMRFLARLRVMIEGGSVAAQGSALRVEGADSAILLLTAGTDYRGRPYESTTARELAAAGRMTYDELRRRHVADHDALFSRARLELGETEISARPTDRRLVAFADGSDDPSLVALYFHFARYLLIGSSRPGTMAANLQGIWADGVQTPWNCDYHTNINVQMNYWLAETCNLAECAEPLVDLVDRMREPGARTARIHYGARGWVVHTIHNVWGFTSPGEVPMWGLSPTAGAWLCQHLWEHYSFGKDEAYLRRVYPIMRQAAEFLLDWLVEDPRTERLVSGPATSPENTFVTKEGDRCSISMGPSMDQEIVWDHFTNLIAAAEALGEKDGLVHRVMQARERLAWPAIGGDGRLMEWAEPFGETEPEHRHVSHLFAVHPGRQITPRATPALAEAARQSLLARGDEGTGWSMAWKICFWARLGDGDHAFELATHLLRPTGVRGTLYEKSGAGVYPNLFCAHPPFQIDGNFGGAAGISEMLLQSHEDAIVLLPALPRAWPSGSVVGLCARGAFEVDMTWRQCTLKEVRLFSKHGGICRMRYRDKSIELRTEPGGRYALGGWLG